MRLSADPSTASPEVVETVGTLFDFARFMVRLPHSEGHSLSELGVLRSLVRGGSSRISDLAADQEMTQPGMTQLVTRLEHAGLVTRRGDPSDRRVVLVALTDAGRRLFQERDASRVARFGALYEQLSDDQRARLRAALPAFTQLMRIKEGQADG